MFDIKNLRVPVLIQAQLSIERLVFRQNFPNVRNLDLEVKVLHRKQINFESSKSCVHFLFGFDHFAEEVPRMHVLLE